MCLIFGQADPERKFRSIRPPRDFKGIMGVPISFLDKYCPAQFEILGATESEGKGFSNGLWDCSSNTSQALIDGNRIYKRIFIKHKALGLA